MSTIRQRGVEAFHDAFYLNDLNEMASDSRNECSYFVSTSPLGITGMSVDPAYILLNFRRDGFEQEVIDGIKSIRENKFGPTDAGEL